MCELCNTIAPNLSSYLDHIIYKESISDVDDYRKYQCLMCKTRYFSPSAHSNCQIRCNMVQHKCPLCYEIKSDLIELKLHILRDHCNVQFRWPYCYICCKQVNGDVTRHVLTYHADKFDPTKNEAPDQYTIVVASPFASGPETSAANSVDQSQFF